MLKRRILRPSASSWSSPVVLIQTNDGSVRFSLDHWALNKITSEDVYPMPRLDDAFTRRFLLDQVRFSIFSDTAICSIRASFLRGTIYLMSAHRPPVTFVTTFAKK